MLHVALAIIMVIDFSPSIATHRDARQCFAKVLALSGHGRLATERGAFLVWRGDDRYDCVVWPVTNTLQSARWRGAWPDNTAAVVHTHPQQLPEPSAHDRDEARRLGLPIFVLTPRRWTLVRADGSAAPIFDQRYDRVEQRIDE
jgi:hypothetical protein